MTAFEEKNVRGVIDIWCSWSYIMKAAGHISLFGVFSDLGVSANAKLARPIGWLGLYERKYSPLVEDKYC